MSKLRMFRMIQENDVFLKMMIQENDVKVMC